MADIKATDLIAKFQYALSNKWGYIWGTAGEKWTQSRQDALIRYFVTLYGVNWKKSAKAKKNDRYYGATNGSKWIGHTVADCSGLFYWAFRQLGGYMYHGSNTMYDKYCTSKGQLSRGGRTDGKKLKPGTAVFTGTTAKHGHVGLYVGNDLVIEASGTNAGVITTKISNGKWTFWGELKGVIYGDAPKPEPVPVGYAIVTGNAVAMREGPSTSTRVITRIPLNTRVKIQKQPTEWQYITVGGRTGFMMSSFLSESGSNLVVTGKSVALRGGPSTSCAVLTRVATGTKVKKASQPTDWEYIAFGNKEGFMMKQFLKE